MPDPLLQVDNLRVAVADQDAAVRLDRPPPERDDGRFLPSGWVEVVPGVSYRVASGEVLALIGESASGKSLTLLGPFGLLGPGARAIGGRTTFDGRSFHPAGAPTGDSATTTRRRRRSRRRAAGVAGSVLADYEDDEWRRAVGSEIGFLFQDPIAAWTPVYRIGEQAGEVLEEHTELSRSEITERVIDALGEVQLPNTGRFFTAFREQISRGQGQRAMLAAALITAPRLLIADEPLTGLDAPVAASIMELIRDLRAKRGMAMVIVTHDLAVVARLADRVAVVYGGRIVEEGTTSDIFRHPKHPYTAGLLHSIPAFATGRLQPIPGEAPRLAEVPRGCCAFAERCPFVIDRCRHFEPLLEPIAESAAACHRKTELSLSGVRR